ncbi:MAG: hypothetical protein ACT4QG_11455 [Sporichthyaceae bacterium]
MDPIDALNLCGGAARWSRLLDVGVPRRALGAAVRCGTVELVDRGAYALPGAPPGLVAAVRLGGVASHATAAALYGWPIWTPDERLWVTLCSGHRRSLPGVEVRLARLSKYELERHLACTSPLRTALDCARTMRLVDAVCILDWAVHRGHVTEYQLREAAAAARGPGATALRRAVAHIDPRAASPLESVLRLVLWTTDAKVEPQARIDGVGDVDFLVDGWLVDEGDGYEFHSDRKAYRNDRRRGNELAAQGYGQLRFTYEDLKGRPLWVLEQVERTRRLRGEH